MKDCPRRAESLVPHKPFEYLNKPDDARCDYCGSLDADVFMARLEKGDVVLTPTDKSYKVYIRNVGGEPFKASHRTDNSRERNVDGSPDQTKWVWVTRDVQEIKFYFQHLSEAQMRRFVELLNAKKLSLDVPGHFYVTPFFITYDKPAEKQQ